MQPDPQVSQQYHRARNDLRHYYKFTDREGFRFAFSDLPPFVYVNGVTDGEPEGLRVPGEGEFSGRGPFYDLMKVVAADLGTTPKPIQCEWSEFAEGLARRDF